MIERISRFYLSKKTFMIAAIAIMVLGPVGVALSFFSGEIIPFEWVPFLIIWFSMIGLLITRRKKDYILMNGIISGILITEIIRYGYLIQYLVDGVEYYRSNGFVSCFGVSVIFLTFANLFLIAYNHFTINRMGAINRTKIILNQILLFLSLFSPVAFLFVGYLSGYSAFDMILTAIVYSADFTLFLLVGCCELDLAVNRKDGIVLEEAVSKDIKRALWYALSFLFSLLCLSMAVLLPNTKAFIYWLSGIDFLLSLMTLIYYLNRIKEPSPKGKRLLRISLILTIVFAVFALGYYIWTILS